MKISGSVDIYMSYLMNRAGDWLRGIRGYAQEHRGVAASDYGEWYYNRPLARAYFNSRRRARNLVDMIELTRPARVFEFGSGLGHVVREARRRGLDMTGSETSGYALDHSLCPEFMVRIDEIPPGCIPFQDSSFDLVFSSEVMEHVSEASTIPVLLELRRICASRAIFTINTFDADEFGHINIHPRPWWDEVFAKTGFVIDVPLQHDLERIKILDWQIFALRIQPASGVALMPVSTGSRSDAL